ncbi:MAG: TlpA family protein disulfide reductase [Legionellales bacterium]|nr:TlpA family protein disulfide reductase [Legionellales bacterium]
MNITLKRFAGWLPLLLTLAGCSASLSTVDDKTVSLQQLKGKWVIVTYWADWCDNCQSEILELNKFYREHKSQDVILLGVNFDNLPINQLEKDIAQNHIHYPILKNNPADLLKLGTVDVLPTTFIINPHGKIVYKLMGSQSAETLDKIITTSNK